MSYRPPRNVAGFFGSGCIARLPLAEVGPKTGWPVSMPLVLAGEWYWKVRTWEVEITCTSYRTLTAAFTTTAPAGPTACGEGLVLFSDDQYLGGGEYSMRITLGLALHTGWARAEGEAWATVRPGMSLYVYASDYQEAEPGSGDPGVGYSGEWKSDADGTEATSAVFGRDPETAGVEVPMWSQPVTDAPMSLDSFTLRPGELWTP